MVVRVSNGYGRHTLSCATDVSVAAATQRSEESASVPLKADSGSADADYRLAARCVSGEVAAWEELYAQCHDPLCASIRIMLGRRGSDVDFIDEIAARVWYRLVDNDGELLSRFSPQRGARLITFMRALAKDEVCRHARNEVRRRDRELVAAQSRPRQPEVDLAALGSDLKVFLGTLTPQEHTFCREVLLGVSDGGGDAAVRTRANVWQLTHRVYQKLLRFLGR
jgi:hypothetical protein